MPVVTKNQNRFRKVYPGIRKNSVNQTLYAKKVEATSITLTDESTGTYIFEMAYKTIPAVTASVYDSNGGGNTNVVITAISETQVTIETSQAVTAIIYLQVVEI